MRNLFYLLLMLMILILCGGCNEEETIPAKPKPSPAAKTPTVTAPKVNSAEKTPAPTQYVLANDDFSNLQLNTIDKPVYDKYGVWDRHDAGLPMSLPEIEPYHEKNVAYLTFDDGPDDKITPQILDVLKAEGVKATFFVCGNMVEKNPEVLKRIFNEGHAIGNHSYNHVYKELYKSPWDFVAQFMKTDDIIMEHIGVRPLIIRAPGGVAGVFDEDYWDMIAACGYVEFDWNLSTEDATPSSPNATAQVLNVIKQITTLSPRTAIILMHSKAGKEETVKALPELIRMLREWGYDFGVITPMTPQL